jgi:hypothetical protein
MYRGAQIPADIDVLRKQQSLEQCCVKNTLSLLTMNSPRLA